MPFSFQPGRSDPGSQARRGAFVTRHGRVETPAFMPVGTRATVTGITPGDLDEVGAEIILGNTYHLLLRPGPEAMRAFGGLHRFMAWHGPILTDSGGFQIFSLSEDRTITEAGARFRSYVDCRYHDLTPERSIEIQTALGSDVMMALDVCLPSTAPLDAVRAAMERTHRWALRSLAARTDPEQALFAIVQGGLSAPLRSESASFLTDHAFDGFAIGGLAVGDTRGERAGVIAGTAALLPADRPRYLMGVGTPPDVIEAVAHGIDMFDCVIPTTLAWQGTAFTSTGRVRLTRGAHRLSDQPLDRTCTCSTCRLHSRGYLHHLVKCGEPLGPRLLSLHNLHHYLALMRAIRAAIDAGRYATFAREMLDAIDRHEHDPERRQPGVRRPGLRAPAEPGGMDSGSPATGPATPAGGSTSAGDRFEIVPTRGGAAAIRDRVVGELMHPIVGAVESEQLYVAQSRLRERLLDGAGPLVLFDVGLGAGSNALAAIRAARSARPAARGLEVVSFERDTGALALAISPEGAARLGIGPEDLVAGRALLACGEHRERGIRWRLAHGDARANLPLRDDLADIVFWDPFSPRQERDLWTLAAFSALHRRCAPGATLFTYSCATAVRSALLLAGFFVGIGDASGSKEATTAATMDPRDLSRPLDRRWLDRLTRSSAAFPPDAPEDALERIRAHPQFR